MSAAFVEFAGNLRWMGWNLFLAIVPCVLSIILFRQHSDRKFSGVWLWWLGFAIFVLFLPNASYIATDIIHFVSDSRREEISRNGVIFILIPQYILFLVLGFQCHVVSLMRLCPYLHKRFLAVSVLSIELITNFICAFGVYLGRFNRLNSWHIITKPDKLLDNLLENFSRQNFFLITLFFFVVISILYYLFKWLNLAIYHYWQDRKTQQEV